jgi:hypothetical protein
MAFGVFQNSKVIYVHRRIEDIFTLIFYHRRHLAPIRMLFDWLSPAKSSPPTRLTPSAARNTWFKTGKTTVLDAEQARRLLDSIDTSIVVGLRDRAPISVMTFAFVRICTVVACVRLNNASSGRKRHIWLVSVATCNPA